LVYERRARGRGIGTRRHLAFGVDPESWAKSARCARLETLAERGIGWTTLTLHLGGHFGDALPRAGGAENHDYATMPEMSNEPEQLVALYRRAFAEYGTRALWNMRPVENPTPAAALAITKPLRTHGGMDGRRLAEQIEELCRADR